MNVTIGDLMVIVEYCRFGNILDFLVKHRSVYVDQVDATTGSINSFLGMAQTADGGL